MQTFPLQQNMHGISNFIFHIRIVVLNATEKLERYGCEHCTAKDNQNKDKNE